MSHDNKDETPTPWFAIRVWPTVVILVGVTLLLLDGLTPYRTWWRRGHWKQVKGTLIQSVERRQRIRASAGGETPIEYLSRRPQQRIFPKVVTRGWPLSRKKKVWEIRLSYTYALGRKRYTRVSDTCPLEFKTRKEAARYLGPRITKQSLRVYVNPKDPHEATMFMDYGTLVWMRLGGVFFGIGLIWLIAAFYFGRSYRKGQKKEPQETPETGVV